MTVTVVVIDEDEAVLDAVKLLLEEEGWRVRAYSSGEAFLADLPGHGPPSCLVLDPHLRGMSGADVVRALVVGSAPIPVIGITARPTSPVSTAVVEAGVHAMLTKPASAEELIGRIRSVIER